MLCSTSVVTVIAGNYLIPLLKEYVDYCGVETVRKCRQADSTHSSNEQPVSTGSNLPWRATNSYTCHETNLFW